LASTYHTFGFVQQDGRLEAGSADRSGFRVVFWHADHCRCHTEKATDAEQITPDHTMINTVILMQVTV
jgi:hypothetical protein